MRCFIVKRWHAAMRCTCLWSHMFKYLISIFGPMRVIGRLCQWWKSIETGGEYFYGCTTTPVWRAWKQFLDWNRVSTRNFIDRDRDTHGRAEGRWRTCDNDRKFNVLTIEEVTIWPWRRVENMWSNGLACIFRYYEDVNVGKRMRVRQNPCFRRVFTAKKVTSFIVKTLNLRSFSHGRSESHMCAVEARETRANLALEFVSSYLIWLRASHKWIPGIWETLFETTSDYTYYDLAGFESASDHCNVLVLIARYRDRLDWIYRCHFFSTSLT